MALNVSILKSFKVEIRRWTELRWSLFRCRKHLMDSWHYSQVKHILFTFSPFFLQLEHPQALPASLASLAQPGSFASLGCCLIGGNYFTKLLFNKYFVLSVDVFRNLVIPIAGWRPAGWRGKNSLVAERENSSPGDRASHCFFPLPVGKGYCPVIWKLDK